MHLAITFGVLGLLTIAVIALRMCWWHLPRWVRRLLLVLSVIMVAIRFFFLVSQWSTMSTRVNALLCWTAVAGYEILLARFSLMRPQWLTSLCALILLFPVIGSTLLIPLTRVFDWSPADISSLGGHYVLEKSPWDSDSSGNTGLDLVVFYRPRLMPFLRHLEQRISFGDDQCDAKASTATVDPNQKVVQFRCPGRLAKQSDLERTLPLR